MLGLADSKALEKSAAPEIPPVQKPFQGPVALDIACEFTELQG